MILPDVSFLGQATVAASAAILIVALFRAKVRLLFGARIAYALWLIVPLAIIASLLPSDVRIKPVPPAPEVSLVESMPAEQTAPTVPELTTPLSEGQEPSLLKGLASWFVLIWLSGFFMSLSLQLVGHLRFVRRNRLAARSGRVCRAVDNAVGPSVVGLFNPCIVVPKNFSRAFNRRERALIFAHERAHLTAGDAPVNGLAVLLRSLFWFNPLAYAAYHLFRMDQELACDERVMTQHGQHRRLYAETLLKSQMASQSSPLACAWLPGGLHPLKERVAGLSSVRHSSIRRTAGVMAVLAAVGVTSSVAWATLSTHTVEIRSGAALADRQQNGSQLRDARRNDRDDLSDAQGAALVNAILDGRNNHARALIRAGADINFKLSGDGTPLIVAVRRGDMDMLKLLIDQGADIDGYVRGDGTPLVVAAQEDDVSIARFLIEGGADVNHPAPGDGNPLIMAARFGSLELVQTLVEAGADVNGFVLWDETPLIGAAMENRIEIARYLIEQGADVNLKVETGNGPDRPKYRTPLGQAKLMGHGKMVRLLRDAGAVDVTEPED